MLGEGVVHVVNGVICSIAEDCRRTLAKHPTIHKIVIVAFHVFRSAMMYAFMTALPLSFAGKCTVGLAVSLSYRLLVERMCQFKFALPSFWGALALSFWDKTWIPCALYAVSVVQIVHTDVNRLRRWS